MLSRYTIYRRRPPEALPLPVGIRQDSRHRTQHILRPTSEMVEAFLAEPSDAAWNRFESEYIAELGRRFRTDNTSFVQLATLAAENDVFLGCSCPTKKNPDVRHCHTYVALMFMKEKFPSLNVVPPQ